MAFGIVFFDWASVRLIDTLLREKYMPPTPFRDAMILIYGVPGCLLLLLSVGAIFGAGYWWALQ